MTGDHETEQARSAIADHLELVVAVWRGEAIEGSVEHDAAAMAAALIERLRAPGRNYSYVFSNRGRAPLALLTAVFTRIAAEAHGGRRDGASLVSKMADELAEASKAAAERSPARLGRASA